LTPEALAAKRRRRQGNERNIHVYQLEADRVNCKACRAANKAIIESRLKARITVDAFMQEANTDVRRRWTAI